MDVDSEGDGVGVWVMGVGEWRLCSVVFFFNDTATTEIYTLSLHDALPISGQAVLFFNDYSNLLGSDLAAAGGAGSGDLFNGGEIGRAHV